MGYPKEYSDEEVTPKRESPNTSPAGRQRAATLGTPVKKLSQAVLPPQKRYHQFYDGGDPDHDSDDENGDDDDYLSDEEVERRNAFNASFSGTYSPTSSSSPSNVRAYGLDPAPYSSKTRLPKAASSSSAASGIRSPPLRDSSGGGGFTSDDRFFQEMENLKLSGSAGSNASTSASGTSSRSASQLIDLDWASPPPSSSSSSSIQKPLPQFPQQSPLLLQPQQQPTFNLPQTPTSPPASLYSTPTPLYPFGSAASSGNPFIIPQPQSPPPSQQHQQQHQASDLAIQEQQQLFLQQQHALLQQQLLQQQLLLQQQQYAAQMLKQQGSVASSDDGMTSSPSNGARSRAQTVSPNWKPMSSGGDYPSYFPTSTATTTPTSPLSQSSQMQLLQPQQQQHMGQQQPISPTSSNAWMYQ